MKITECLEGEIERLRKINDEFEQQYEPERIVDNVKAMCEIANTICNLHYNGIV